MVAQHDNICVCSYNAVDIIECLNQIKLPISINTCAAYSELPFNFSTMTSSSLTQPYIWRRVYVINRVYEPSSGSLKIVKSGYLNLYKYTPKYLKLIIQGLCMDSSASDLRILTIFNCKFDYKIKKKS